MASDPTPQGNAAQAGVPAKLQFSTASYGAPAGEERVIIEVTRAGDLSGQVTVNYATSDGTARAGLDYAHAAGPLAFDPGEGSKTFEVLIIGRHVELAPTINLTLSNPSPPAAAQLGEPASATITIQGRYLPFAFFKSDAAWRLYRHFFLSLLLVGLTYYLSMVFLGKGKEIACDFLKHLMPENESVLCDTSVRFLPGASAAASPMPAPTAIPFAQSLFLPPPASPSPPPPSGGQPVRRQQPAPAQPKLSPGQHHIDDVTKERIGGQYAETRRRMALHLEAMKVFISNAYMAVLTSITIGALAVIALILISKRGWEQTNPYLINVFLVMGALTAYYASFYGLFKQEQNFNENRALFLKYEALRGEILSYAATGEVPRRESAIAEALKSQAEQQQAAAVAASAAPAGGRKGAAAAKPEKLDSKTGITFTPAEFIHYVDVQLAQETIPLGIDVDQGPNYKEALTIK